MVAGAASMSVARPPHPSLSINELGMALDRQLSSLGSIVMHEEITRYDRLRSKARRIDEFEALVEMTDGADGIQQLTRNGRPWSSAAQIPGAWSFGEFSTLLRISREALEGPSARLARPSDGDPDVLVATFHIPASSARWFVKIGSHTWWLDFEGEIRMSAATGEVREISWTSAPLARDADVDQIRRTVRFAPMEVGGEMYVLPEYAEYRVVHSGGHVEWNTAQFKNPARYGSRVSIEFEQ